MKEELPLVSVLMPVYNAALHVRQAIESILNQTFKDFELIVFNDGSTDTSSDVIKEIKDERLIFVDSSTNVGYVAHLNKGLQLARGKYVARMDADDISMPNRFEQQVSFLDNNLDVGLCGTSYSTFGAKETIISVPESDEEIREFLLRNSPFGHPTVMFRKALIEEYNLCYDRSFMPAEDYKLWYDISKVSKLHNIPDVLLQYRIHPHQISSYLNSTQRSNADKVRLIQLKDKGFVLTTEEQILYCHIIQYAHLPQTVIELESWRLLMQKITVQNRELRAYNDSWFEHIFLVAWNEAVSGIKNYSLGYMWPIFVKPKPTSKSLGLLAGLRIAIKCLVQWNARPVSVNSISAS